MLAEDVDSQLPREESPQNILHTPTPPPPSIDIYGDEVVDSYPSKNPKNSSGDKVFSIESNPEDILRHYWGYKTFRPMQKEIINSVINGNDTIGLLPTGGGKSITFQVPALMFDGLTIVITPLISLMKDQVDALVAKHIPAGCLYGGMDRAAIDYVFDRIDEGRLKILYIAPERLASDRFTHALERWEISLLVVDEAHCISQWGYDFRPSYLQIASLRELVPQAPVLALTASATPDVVTDIANSLELHKPNTFSLSFRRQNISFIVRHSDNKLATLIHILTHTKGSSIIYVRSRARCKEIADYLESENLSATYYHAGLDVRVKSLRQDDWLKDKVRIMVATTAFGMGIDKPDVRLVVHFDPPSTLEEYYQEAGRAGRDGKPSYAVIISAASDKAIFGRRLSESFPSRDVIEHTYNEINRFLDIWMGEGDEEMYDFDPEDMCRKYKLSPSQTLGAIHILERAGYWDFYDCLKNRSRIQVIVKREELYSITLEHNEDLVLNTILRHYTGVFSDLVSIDEILIGYIANIAERTVVESLIFLSRKHIIKYIPRSERPALFIRQRRVESKHLILPREIYADRRLDFDRRLGAMRNFIFADDSCRVVRMLKYFGESDAQDCGKCDICRARKQSTQQEKQLDIEAVNEHINQIFAAYPHPEIDLRSLYDIYLGYEQQLTEILRTLADRGSIILTPLSISLPKDK